MRGLKVALLLELELGCVWMLTLLAAPAGEAGLVGLMLFVPIYLVHLVCMILGGVYLAKRPEARALAAAVISVPLMLLFAPGVLRAMAGGPIDVHPMAWGSLIALPLATLLFLPHHVASFLPAWTLRSRAWNVCLVVLLSIMVLPWLGFFVFGPATAVATGEAPIKINDPEQTLEVLLGAFVFAALSLIVAGFTLLTSYVGLFQKIDRGQTKLRVAQLILSILVLLPSAVTVAAGLFLFSIALANPG